MDAGFDARLTAGDVAFDERDAALLRAVDAEGSLNAAADGLNRSYSRAHARLTDLEDAFGPLVDRQRGGSGGGGSALTENAADVLARFDRLRTGYAGIAETTEAVFDGEVASRNGELATVDTAAGRLSALVPPDASSVSVAVRADAVTLHDPADSPEPDATSARNRFSGTVTAVERGDAVSRVTIDVNAATPLYALLTNDSVERLALAADAAVVASFKATATRATPRR
ncbi:TOBE domain-containing protein [Salarchaeum sp. JOR-1]|uniref:TOBE domain-containing protein n=1 Tax=Salarchaeum sp. JOR-1 TaxID=2599399 RepID=UPI0011989F96|nr:TOBE domain-containing protein [Salarchaeum sp. JOR-1]QDX40466.1 LysR family transcriptional regulator [Salarchaeum sp. JOR-1]